MARKPAFPAPSAEHLAAVAVFKATYCTPAGLRRRGCADWRECLAHAWMHGWDADCTDGGHLRHLRNNGGPAWLRAQA